jgi:hypothetical protein
MQDPDNNMDDLLRKAAEHYRPALGESDWDKIAAGLLQGGGTQPARSSNIKRKIGYSTLLVILFLFAGSPYQRIFFSNTQNTTFTNYSIKYQPLTALNKPNSDTRNNFEDRASLNISEQGNTNQTVIAKNEEKENKIKTTTVSYSSNGLLPKKTERLNNTNASGTAQIAAPLSANSITTTFTNENLPTPKLPGNTTTDKLVFSETEFNKSQANINDTVENKLIKNMTALPPKKKLEQSGFYVGAAVGFEFDGVKQLNANRMGYKLGLIAGYQINNRISLETGLLYNKKNYNAEGKYFNMEKVSAAMPAGMQIISLKGNCSEYEMPVNLIYKIANTKTKNIYFSAGVSSYLLSKESNLYNTILDGNQKYITGSYQKSTGYIAATVNLSIGYESKLNTGNALRVEPYLQLPLKGIGVGKLNVMSVGVHAGYLLFKKN